MTIKLTPGAGAVVLGALAVGFVAWRGAKIAGGIADSIAKAPGAIYDAAAEAVNNAAEATQAAAESITPQYVVDNGGWWETNMATLRAINPASDQNLIYRGTNYELGGGDSNWTLGGWIYDATHTEQSTGGASGSWR